MKINPLKPIGKLRVVVTSKELGAPPQGPAVTSGYKSVIPAFTQVGVATVNSSSPLINVYAP
jgi:hypothetical protein